MNRLFDSILLTWSEQMTAMKCNFILFLTVCVAELIHSAELSNICEQLKNNPNVGILALVIVPIHRKLLFLTTNFFAIEIDFYLDVTYPSQVGYPQFLPLTNKETWTVKISPTSVFDVLSSEERRKWKSPSAPVPPAGFIIHNDSMSNYYVVDVSEVNAVVGEDTFEVNAQVERTTFIWRALDPKSLHKRIVTTNRPVEKKFCVSSQEPGRTFLVAVDGAGGRCFQRTDFFSSQTNGQLFVASYSSAFKRDCKSVISSSSVHLCGALINELLFAVDNTAKTVSIYQDPILSNLTQLIQTVPFTDFFYCYYPWSILTKAAIVLAIIILTGVILFFLCNMVFEKRKKARSQSRLSQSRWSRYSTR